MATTKNAGSLFLASANPRLLNVANAAILLSTSSPVFHLNSAGVSDTASVTIKATLLYLDGTVTFSATGGTVSGVVGNTCLLAVADMTATTASVTATLVYRGDTFATTVKISKVSDGATGGSFYTWIKYGDDAAGAGLSDSPTGKKYIGLGQNKTTAVESTNPLDYTWSLISGTDGVPGTPGTNGVTLYTWIAYSDYPDGTSLYQTPNANTLYIGISPNQSTATESSLKGDYTWSKFKGDQGVQGNTGATGNTGSTGTTGDGRRIAYAKTTANSMSATPTTITTSGNSTFPAVNSWSTGAVWTASPSTLAEGESQYQSDGIYSPTSGNTVWSVPYLSSLKVGSLEAINTKTGSLTVTGTITAGSGKTTIAADGTMNIKSTTSGTGARLELRNDLISIFDSAGALRVKIGNLL